MNRRPAGCLDFPPVAGPFAGPVDRPEPSEDDAFDIVRLAGGEEVGGVGAGEAAEHPAWAAQGQLLESPAPFEVGPVEQRLVVDPEEGEGPGRGRRRRPGVASTKEYSRSSWDSSHRQAAVRSASETGSISTPGRRRMAATQATAAWCPTRRFIRVHVSPRTHSVVTTRGPGWIRRAWSWRRS